MNFNAIQRARLSVIIGILDLKFSKQNISSSEKNYFRVEEILVKEFAFKQFGALEPLFEKII